MRLILLNQHMRIKDLSFLAQDTVILYCFEDFTIGPLSSWNDPGAFWKTRADLFEAAPVSLLPDGTRMEYFIWMQLHPRLEVADMIHMREEDIPAQHTLESAAPPARRIEIWCNTTPCDQLWRWWVIATLNRLDVPLPRIKERVMKTDFWDQMDPKVSKKMLLDAPDADPPAVAVSSAEAERAQRLWAIATRYPCPIPDDLRHDAVAQDVFRTLGSRQVDPRTGISPVQLRLLRALTEDWRKMARVIGDAMYEGIEQGDHVGDGFLQAELWAMARRDPALVDIVGEGAMRYCQARLTAQGHDLREIVRKNPE